MHWWHYIYTWFGLYNIIFILVKLYYLVRSFIIRNTINYCSNINIRSRIIIRSRCKWLKFINIYIMILLYLAVCLLINCSDKIIFICLINFLWCSIYIYIDWTVVCCNNEQYIIHCNINIWCFSAVIIPNSQF